MKIRIHLITIATLAMAFLLASCGGGATGPVNTGNFEDNIDEDVIITDTGDNEESDSKDDNDEGEKEDETESSKGPLSIRMVIGTKEAVAGRPYAATFMAGGGSGKYSWSATSLPEGLSISGSKISGIISTAGSYELAIKAADREDASITGELVFSLTVKASEDGAPGTGGISDGHSTMPKIITVSLKDAKYGEEYESENLQASGGNGDYKWEISNLPKGLELENGIIKGRPLEIGDFSLNVKVSYEDENGSGHATGEISLKILMKVDVMLIEGGKAEFITNLSDIDLGDSKKIVIVAHASSPKFEILAPASNIVRLETVIADGAQEVVIDRSEDRLIPEIKIEVSDGRRSKEIITFANIITAAKKTETGNEEPVDAIVSKVKVQILTSGLFKNGNMHVKKDKTPLIEFSPNEKFKQNVSFAIEATDWKMGEGKTFVLDLSSQNIKKSGLRYFRIKNRSDDMWAIGAVKISASTLEEPNTFETIYFNPMSNVIITNRHASFGPNDRAFFIRTEVANEKNAGDGDDPAYLVLSRKKDAPQSIIDEMKNRDTSSGFSKYESFLEDYELNIKLDRSGNERRPGEINHYGTYFFDGNPVDRNRWQFTKYPWTNMNYNSNYLKLNSLTVMAISPGSAYFLKNNLCDFDKALAPEIGDGRGGLSGGDGVEIIQYPAGRGYCPTNKSGVDYTEDDIKNCFFNDYERMETIDGCSTEFKKWNDEENGTGNIAPDDWFDF